MSGCKTRNLQCKITSQLHSTRPLMTTGAKPFKKSWTLMTIASFWWTKGVAEEVIDGQGGGEGNVCCCPLAGGVQGEGDDELYDGGISAGQIGTNR